MAAKHHREILKFSSISKAEYKRKEIKAVGTD